MLGKVRYPQPYRRLARAGGVPPERVSTGEAADQRAEVRRPQGAARGVAVLIHGGFWREVWRCDLMNSLASDLCRRGLVTWNIEYRRVGSRGDAWPGLLEDVAAAWDALAGDAAAGLPRVVVGHSAGGQLALWLAQRERAAGRSPAGVVSLAGVGDLVAAAAHHLGGDAAQDLCGGEPAEVPGRYALADPRQRLPVGCPLLLVHGEHDEAVPVGFSREFAAAARGAGDTDLELLVLPGVGHSALVDPAQEFWVGIRAWIDARIDGAASPQVTGA